MKYHQPAGPLMAYTIFRDSNKFLMFLKKGQKNHQTFNLVDFLCFNIHLFVPAVKAYQISSSFQENRYARQDKGWNYCTLDFRCLNNFFIVEIFPFLQ